MKAPGSQQRVCVCERGGGGGVLISASVAAPPPPPSPLPREGIILEEGGGGGLGQETQCALTVECWVRARASGQEDHW